MTKTLKRSHNTVKIVPEWQPNNRCLSKDVPSCSRWTKLYRTKRYEGEHRPETSTNLYRAWPEYEPKTTMENPISWSESSWNKRSEMNTTNLQYKNSELRSRCEKAYCHVRSVCMKVYTWCLLLCSCTQWCAHCCAPVHGNVGSW